MRDWLPVTVVAVLFVGFCLAFNRATPYRQAGVLLHQRGPDGRPLAVPDVGAPDERQHANYVIWLMAGKGLPVLRPGSADLYETYQAHQPPLYYALACAWCKALGSDPITDGFALRLFNTVVGLATLAALALGSRWAGASWPVAWAACSVLLMPMSVALHSAASNDPLLVCLCTWSMATLSRGLTQGWTLKRAVVCGLLIGAALLTKTTAVALLLSACVAAWPPTPGLKPAARWAALVGLPLVLVLPLWARNVNLYGDPLALKAFNQAFVGSPQASAFLAAVGPYAYWVDMVGWWTGRSLIGVFGYMDLFMFEASGMRVSDAIYKAMLLAFVGLTVLGLSRAAGRARGSSPARWTLATQGSFVALVGVSFLRFNLQYFQGQGRYLYPALGPVAWLIGGGVCRLFGSRKSWAWVALAAGLSLLDWVAVGQLTSGFRLRVG